MAMAPHLQCDRHASKADASCLGHTKRPLQRPDAEGAAAPWPHVDNLKATAEQGPEGIG